MNKFPFANSTQRNSVNSSFSTVKNCQFSSFYDTANKQFQGKRFSYQEINNHQQTSQKENMRINSIEPTETLCINHQSKFAQFIALEASDDPMHLCQRCAILVASKGFQISKIQQRKMKKVVLPINDLKIQATETFSSIKIKKSQVSEKLGIFAAKLQKKINFIDEYFRNLHEYIQREKSIFLKQIFVRKTQIQSLWQQSNNFYLQMLERIKQISIQKSSATQSKLGQLSKELKEMRKQTFEINFEDLKYPLKLKDMNEVFVDISHILRSHSYKQIETDINFKLKCEQQNSQIRSLQLSFEEDNNFTLNAQQTNRTGQF